MSYRLGCFGVLNLEDMDSPLYLCDGGIELRQQEKYDFYNDRRPDFSGYLFQYTLRGTGYFQKVGKLFTLTPGMGFFASIPENSRYFLIDNVYGNYTAPSGDCTSPPENCITHSDNAPAFWELLYLHFDGPAVRPFADRLNSLCNGVFSLSPDSTPIRMLLLLQERLTTGGHLEKYESGELLYRFLCALLREIENPTGNTRNPLSEKAASLMRQEYALLSGIEELSGRLGISAAHLTRQFSADMGISPLRYLTKLRIQSAMNDLLNSDSDLESIAMRNGFSGSNYFCKVFRKNVGLSPTQYRKSKG